MKSRVQFQQRKHKNGHKIQSVASFDLIENGLKRQKMIDIKIQFS